jgi:hypothetical protein
MHESKYKINTMYHQKEVQNTIEICNEELEVCLMDITYYIRRVLMAAVLFFPSLLLSLKVEEIFVLDS